MKMFHHDHPLTLVDLNPLYPHDEQVYDDEYDLIEKQAFQSLCNLCCQEITFLHRYYYKCDQCNFLLHKSCAKLPSTLEHASHSAHTFTLFQDESQWLCHLCVRHPPHKQRLCYHCSQCEINICLDCCMNGAQYDPIYHPSHLHPLFPIYRENLACCDACGKEHKGFFYICATCFCSFIHNDCVFLPKRSLIQDRTHNRFSHTHTLILTYSFSKVDQKAKFDPPCRVCDNSFSNEKLWLYKCEKCRYYVHVDCANSGVVKTLEEYEDPIDDALHLPLLDQTYNILTNLFSKETNKTTRLTHNSHKHPLILVNSQRNDITMTQTNGVEDLCNGCVKPIMNMSCYKCTYGCNFVLHEWCTRLPAELKGYIRHPQHTLILLPKVTREVANLFCCSTCYCACNGFAYGCVECNYYVDVWCALVPPKIIHKSHPCHLLSKTHKRLNKDYCRICLSGFMHPVETSLSCKGCNFHLHLGCAFFLPETTRHKYDKHPMTLSYRPIENHEGDYFCEVCEEELNPNASFYHCYECVQSMHINCAPLVPPPRKPYISRWEHQGENIKYGSIHKIKYHPHPVSFLKWTRSDNRCMSCHIQTHRNVRVLKCLECGFIIHLNCWAL
ncbi:hypothetical protein SSX86_021353 [Deinandra increscens subsp. villosa]|uniref:PHD-type domain-containing protein n=1 Tax=Deinandra increscens subsp. villosa TaxID=3103831 RepID=A0AAP0CUU3_9ASTR